MAFSLQLYPGMSRATADDIDPDSPANQLANAVKQTWGLWDTHTDDWLRHNPGRSSRLKVQAFPNEEAAARYLGGMANHDQRHARQYIVKRVS